MKLDKTFDLSREASDYEASKHLIQRMKERKDLEGDVVATVIEEGDIVDVDENYGGPGKGITLRGDWLMTTFEVILCPSTMEIKTAYEVES